MSFFSVDNYAVLIRDDVEPEAYVELANRQEYEAAGWLLNIRTGSRCSAVLVGERTVLAASHCFGDNPSALGWLFGVGPNIGVGTSADVSPIASVVQHPEWDASIPLRVINAGDSAVLTLARPITSVRPATISGRDAHGKVGVFVGYGGQGTVSSGVVAGGLSGIQDRLAGQIRLTNSNELLLRNPPLGHPWLIASFDAPPSPDALPLGAALAGGDSGGPVFVDGEVVGFLSTGGGLSVEDDPFLFSNLTWLGNPTIAAWLSSGVLDTPPPQVVLPDEVTDAFPGSLSIEDDWVLNREFGYFNIAFFPWVYHESLGWIYVDEPADGGVYFYDLAEGGWLFSTLESIPFYYSFGEEDWVLR